MSFERPLVRMRRARFAAALMSLAFGMVSPVAEAQTAGSDKLRDPSEYARPTPSPPLVETPPSAAPAEAAASSLPEGPKTAAATLPTSPSASSSIWSLPMILLGCGVGVEFVGLAFTVGAYVAVKDTEDDVIKAVPNASTWGCRGATQACGQIRDGNASAQTAALVGAYGFAISSVIGGGLIFVGSIALVRSLRTGAAPKTEGSVRVAPGPGGVVIHGTF